MRIKGDVRQPLAAGFAALLLMGMSVAPPLARPHRTGDQANPSGERRLAAGRFAHVDTAEAPAVACAPWQSVAYLGGDLGGIAAVSPTDIWAVGAVGQDPNWRALIEHWDGTRWRVALNGPPGELSSIAVVSATDVWAVGAAGQDPNRRALIEHWDGQTWRTVQGAPGVGPLTGISAVTHDDVWAVGYSDDPNMTGVMRWDGRRWRRVRDADFGPGGGALYAVAAISARDVWAVGSTSDQYYSAVIEHWDGHRWRIMPSPNIDAQTSRLDSIAGIAADDVWAVGGFGNSTYLPNFGGGGTVIEHWDGRRWRLTPSPPFDGELADVSPVSARDVWAVGGSIIEHWDGRQWRVVPGPQGGGAALTVVSPGNIWALGGTAIEHYTGSLCYTNGVRTRTIAVEGAGPFTDGYSTVFDPPGALVMDGVNGRAFVRNDSGNVFVLDPARGIVVGRPHVRAAAPITVDEKNRRVYVPDGAVVHVLDAVTGTPLRTIAVGLTSSLVAVDDRNGRVFVAGVRGSATAPSGSVSIVDAATGKLTRTVPLDGVPTALVIADAGRRLFVVRAGGIVVLDAATGALVHRISGLAGLAVDKRGNHVFSTWTHGSPGVLTLVMLDARDGQLSRRADIARGANAYHPVLMVDELAHRVFVTSNVGSVGILDTDNWTLLRTITAGADCGATGLAVDARAGRIYVPCVMYADQYGTPLGPGTVEVLDVSNGALLSTVTVGSGPDGIAIDDRSGRVLVLDNDGVTTIEPGAGTTTPARSPTPADPAAPVPGERYFPRGRHNLGEPFLSFWLRYGGVDTFGYPQTEPFVQGAQLVQYTDRALLQVVDGQVAPAPLGRLLTRGRAFAPVAPFPSGLDRVYFTATRHGLSGRFLAYWRTRHGDIVLGAPISEVIVEGNGDGSGRRYPLQWFERGRLEYHAANRGTHYDVQLGLLGAQALHRRGLM